MEEVAAAAPARNAGPIALALLWLLAGVAAVAPGDADPEAPAPRALRRVMEPALPGPGAGGGGDLGAITATHVDAAGALWLGTRRGEVWVAEDGGRNGSAKHFDAPDVAAAPIAAIATRGEDVWVASTGVWRGTRAGRLETLPLFAGARIADVAAHPERGVAVALDRGVWRDDVKGWRRVWRAAATAVAFTPEGDLWIGTRDGLVELDRTGRVRRELPGVPIAAAAVGADGALHAATRGSGLLLRYAGRWRRVDAAGGRDLAHIAGLATARGGALFLALRDGGLLRAGPAGRATPHVSAR